MKPDHDNKDAARIERENRADMNSAQLRDQRKPDTILVSPRAFEGLDTWVHTPITQEVGYVFKREVVGLRGSTWMHGEVTDNGIVWNKLEVLK